MCTWLTQPRQLLWPIGKEHLQEFATLPTGAQR